MRYPEFLINLIKDNNLNTIAEIGVWKGDNASEILYNAGDTVKTYIGVDPYIMHDPEFTCENVKIHSREEGNDRYINVCRILSVYPQFTLLRKLSHEAIDLFKDGFFDMVFIDGDHSYEVVKQDIILWTPKIRSGGFLIGHDYNDLHPGVMQAVNEVLGSNVITPCDSLFYRRV